MSGTYDYDVFISCAFEDKFYAQTLARKLQALGFLVWCDAEEAVATSSLLRLRPDVIENSATCVLLMGAGGKYPWLDNAIRDAIRSRVNRTHGLFRVVTVALPGTDVDVVRRRTGSFMRRPDGLRPTEVVVHFKESLDEESALHELVLGIRGVAPCERGDWLGEDFGESVRSRARSVLNVDWLRLFLDFNPSALNTSVRNDERPYHLSIVNPVETTEDGRRHAETFGRERHLGPLELLGDGMGEASESSIISQPNYETLGEFTHPTIHSEMPVSLLTSISHHAAAPMVMVLMMMVTLLVGASVYIRRVYLTRYVGGGGPPIQAGSNQNAVQNGTSAPDVLVDTNENLQGHDKEGSRNTDSTRLRKKRASPRSLAERSGDTPKARLAGPPPGAPAVEPSVSGASTAWKTQLLESGGPETSNPYAEDHRKAFANISGIFINKLDGRVVSEETFLKTFGEALGGEGINMFFRKEDRRLANLSAEMNVVSNQNKDGGYGIVVLTVKNKGGIVVGEFHTRTRHYLNDKVLQTEQIARELNRQIRSCVEDARDTVRPEPKSRLGPRGIGNAS